MNPDLWPRIKDAVARAVDLDDAARQAVLDELSDQPEARAEAESLLLAYDRDGDRFEPPVRLTAEAEGPTARTGDRVGNYRLMDHLGEGGMGRVFAARQDEPIRRDVAIKIIRAELGSEEAVRRFQSEQNLLARMSHRNIAGVIEAGSHDGQPFFAMELIDGQSIDRFCDQRRLDLRARIRLIVEVCRGVQHAHKKGIIHRDLKPSNVLVTIEDDVAVPKIIDFGIAKALGPETTAMTLAGQGVGTPDYMSPEQALGSEMSADTRSDVYSLGVLLYKLLAGVLPIDAGEIRRREGAGEWLRKIQEEDPKPPSQRLLELEEGLAELAENRGARRESLIAELRGDLDAVVLKALSRDPERRYQFPLELAEDLERHLRDEPVLARSPSRLYFLGRWMRRHRLAVAVLGTLLMSLSLGIAGTSWALVKARHAEREAQEQAQQAQQEAVKAEQIKEFLRSLFEASNNELLEWDPELTLREVLDRGAERVRAELRDEPLVQAELMVSIGNSYRAMAQFPQALELFHDALTVYETHKGKRSLEVARCKNNIGTIMTSLGKKNEAAAYLREAAEIWRERSPDDPFMSSLLSNLAVALKNIRKPEESLEVFQQALEHAEKNYGPDHGETAMVLTGLGLLRHDMGALEESSRLLERAVEVSEEVFGTSHPRLSYALNNLAVTRGAQGRVEEARELFARALAIDERFHGPEHLNVAYGLANLGLVSLDLGDCRRAEDYLTRTLKLIRHYFSEDHAMVVEITARLEGLDENCEPPSEEKIE